MFYVEKLNQYQTDLVGMAEEIQMHRNNGDDLAAERVEEGLLNKLNDWEMLIKSFRTFNLIGAFDSLNMLENVDTAKKFIKDDIIVSNCIDVAMDIKKFKEMI